MGHGGASEKRLAKSLGATLTAASGARRSDKGDMKLKAGTRKFRLEAKSTTNLTMKLDIGWLVKIESEARATNCRPGLIISFVTLEGKALSSGDWVMVPRTDFEEMVDALSAEG